MKKILVLGLGLLLNIGFCFAGTLHIRVASIERGGCWEFLDKKITCTFSRIIGDNIAVFVKPDGKTVMLGFGQEWWYEE